MDEDLEDFFSQADCQEITRTPGYRLQGSKQEKKRSQEKENRPGKPSTRMEEMSERKGMQKKGPFPTEGETRVN